VQAQVVDHLDRPGEAPKAVARTGGAARITSQAALDTQDSCYAPPSLRLPAAPARPAFGSLFSVQYNAGVVLIAL
jgi:hypothetical protein